MRAAHIVLFRLLHCSQPLDLAPLPGELPLLLVEPCLDLCLLRFLVLLRTAEGKTSNAAQRTTDCRARARRTHRRTDYRTGRRA